MNPVSKILDEKSGELLKIDGGASVIDAVRTMVGANVGSLLVTEDDEIVGIVTERDYLRRVALEDRGRERGGRQGDHVGPARRRWLWTRPSRSAWPS